MIYMADEIKAARPIDPETGQPFHDEDNPHCACLYCLDYYWESILAFGMDPSELDQPDDRTRSH
jgi:hypothetical protein